LTELGVITILSPEKKMILVSCTGEENEITGLANIMLNFEGEKGVKISFNLNVIVHEQLSQDFLLGRDFTGQDHKVFETVPHMYLSHHHDITIEEFQSAIDRKLLCKIPLHWTNSSPITVKANYFAVIPPFSTYELYGTLRKSDSKKYILPLEKKGRSTFEICNSTIQKVKTLSVALQFEKTNRVPIFLYNDSAEDIIIERGDDIAEIDIWNDDEFEAHTLDVKVDQDETVYLSCNKASVQTMPDFIKDDPAMTEQEKEDSFVDFLKNGYHHPSMTKIIEEKAALTELYYKSVVEVPDHLFETQFDVNHLPKKERKMTLEMFRKHKQAFSKHAADIGFSHDIEMSIPITSYEPHVQKYIPIPHNLRPQVKAVLDQMLEFGIIRECNEPSLFCSNLLVVNKKDGKNIRILLDGRLLNNYTRRLPAQFVTQHEIFAHLVGKKHVSTIDLSDAFFHIGLTEESQPLTAFYSTAHGKRYCFQRSPQGLRNSPLHLKLLMDKLFGDLADEVIHYVDDIIIATDGTLADHIKAVERVIERLKNGNIRIRPSKIKLAQTHVEFLGIVWRRGTISIPEAKMLAFKNLPSPNTPKKAKSVICALAYYRKFIPNFADLSRNIMELGTVHPKLFKWTEEHEKCFRLLIKHICKNAILHLPDPSRPYYVQTDASHYAGSGRIFQRDDEGHERVLACVSRTFTKTERAYSTIKKEVCALLYTLKTMEFFLQSATRIIVLVDAQAILFLRLCRESSGILLRFSMELSRFDLEIEHVPGENNEVADVLSRHHLDIPKIISEEKQTLPMTEVQAVAFLKRLKCPNGTRFTKEEVAFMLDADSLPNPVGAKKRKSAAKTGQRDIKNTPSVLHNRKIKMPKEVKYAPGAKLPLNHISILAHQLNCNAADVIDYTDFKTASRAVLTGALTPLQFSIAQKDDNYCSRLIANVKNFKKFSIIDGLLFFKGQDRLKLVLPTSLQDVVINAKHFSIFGLHFSKSRIFRDITKRYHVQANPLRKKLRLLQDNCLLCQFNATGSKDQELRRTDYIYAPTVTWAVDLIPNMPMSRKGHKAIFLAVDLFTGYVQLCPIKDRTSQSLIEAVDRTIISAHGIPKFIRSDNEPGLWNSKEFFEYLQPLGIKFFPTSVASPWANSHAERSVRTIKEAARTFLQQEKCLDRWDLYCTYFSTAHNMSTSVYGFSPYELMYGFHKPAPNDLLHIWPNAVDPADYMAKMLPIVEKMREKAQKLSNTAKDRSRSFKNQTRIKKQFIVGQAVAHRQLQVATGPGMGMKPKFTGPYIIEAINDDEVSATIVHVHTNQQMKAHFTNLSIIGFRPKSNRVHTEFDNDLEDIIAQIGEKSTLNSNTRRPLDIPIDPMDNAPLDNVNAVFVDNNGPIGHDFANDIFVVRHDANNLLVDEKDIRGRNPTPLPEEKELDLSLDDLYRFGPSERNNFKPIPDMDDLEFYEEVARNCSSPFWDDTDISSSEQNSDSESDEWVPIIKADFEPYNCQPTISEQVSEKEQSKSSSPINDLGPLPLSQSISSEVLNSSTADVTETVEVINSENTSNSELKLPLVLKSILKPSSFLSNNCFIYNIV